MPALSLLVVAAAQLCVGVFSHSALRGTEGNSVPATCESISRWTDGKCKTKCDDSNKCHQKCLNKCAASCACNPSATSTSLENSVTTTATSSTYTTTTLPPMTTAATTLSDGGVEWRCACGSLSCNWYESCRWGECGCSCGSCGIGGCHCPSRSSTTAAMLNSTTTIETSTSTYATMTATTIVTTLADDGAEWSCSCGSLSCTWEESCRWGECGCSCGSCGIGGCHCPLSSGTTAATLSSTTTIEPLPTAYTTLTPTTTVTLLADVDAEWSCACGSLSCTWEESCRWGECGCSCGSCGIGGCHCPMPAGTTAAALSITTSIETSTTA